MFNENSALVKLWIKLILEGQYTTEQIPNLSNLREVVLGVLTKKQHKSPTSISEVVHK